MAKKIATYCLMYLRALVYCLIYSRAVSARLFVSCICPLLRDVTAAHHFPAEEDLGFRGKAPLASISYL